MIVDTTGLSEQHIRALERFIEKFRKGALEHGNLALNKDWTADMIDELVDCNFYAIFHLLDGEHHEKG